MTYTQSSGAPAPSLRVAPPPPPPTVPHVSADDPLLPFVLAARHGDFAAERELLVRLAPRVRDGFRAAFGGRNSEELALTREVLVNVLKALPTVRGDEPVSNLLASMVIDRARRHRPELEPSEPAVRAAVDASTARANRGADAAALSSVVEHVLTDDAAVLVSFIAVRKKPAWARRVHWALAFGAVLLAAGLAYLAVRVTQAARPASTEPVPR